MPHARSLKQFSFPWLDNFKPFWRLVEACLILHFLWRIKRSSLKGIWNQCLKYEMKRIYINHNEKCSTNKNIERSIWKNRYKKKLFRQKALYFCTDIFRCFWCLCSETAKSVKNHHKTITELLVVNKTHLCWSL